MSEKVKFVARYLDGERMSDLCREFGISRKTGYEIVDRYKNFGSHAFTPQSRKPHRNPNQTPPEIVKHILDARTVHASWGAPKIRVYLARKYPEIKVPAASTIHIILDRNSMIKKKGRQNRYKAQGTSLQEKFAHPNELWCTDFKGQFRMGNQQYCYPLTISDRLSRYLICVEALDSTKERDALFVFEKVFKEYGLPDAIRSDNGVPFSSRSLFGLSKLSIWWLRLGIRIERIAPGCPQQNGVHERMHLTLKQAATKPPAQNLLQQQEVFDSFIQVFNHERPHDGIKNQVPADLYKKSKRSFPTQIEELSYPQEEKTVCVSQCGSLSYGNGRRVFISEVFAGQNLGITQVDEGLWRVRFMNYEIGFFDDESEKFSPKENPFETDNSIRNGGHQVDSGN